jgi:peptidylprolyl isomerase
VRKAVLAVVLTTALSACGGSSTGGDLDTQSDAGSSPDAAATQGPIGPVAGGATGCAPGATPVKVTSTTDLSKKPVVEVPDGPLPCDLGVLDIVEGNGPAAKAGDHLTMKYVGVTWSTGKQFDASWDSGQDFDFTLGEGRVIQGWDQGLVGMKQGGRRQLVIPPDLGYGDQAQGEAIPAGSTLIFVVDLVKIG